MTQDIFGGGIKLAKAMWTQYRAIVQTGFIDVSLDTALSDNEGWMDFSTAYAQYQTYKSTGLNTKIQVREITFGALKESDIEDKAEKGER